MPELVLRNITKKWGNFTAVKDLNLTIEDGAFITLLGPSGCGKTTTLRMLAGLETPTEGEILMDGVTVFNEKKGINVPASKRDVGFLFQNYALWPHMTVVQNIAFGLETLKWSKADIKTRVDEMLSLMKIEQFAERYPAELSGGQQQRVAIARTLAPKPKVLFMDEPLSNLDAKLRAEMRTELKRLHKETGSTFVYVTHDQLEAMTLATKICLMNDGVVQQYAPPLDVYAKPSNLFVADFVGNPTMNMLNAKMEKTGQKKAVISMLSALFEFTGASDFEEIKDLVVGIRPEFISIDKDGKIAGTVYSTLPAGMETTVRIQVGESMISSVMFGSVDYKVDTPVNLNVCGNKILLFDKKTGENKAIGSMVKKEK